MKESKPLFGPAWLRVIVYCVVLSGVLAALAFSSRPLLAKLFPAKDLPPEKTALVFALGAVVTGVLALGLTFGFRRLVDRRSFSSLGWSSRGRFRDMAAGFCFSLAIVGAATFSLWVTGHLKWVDVLPDPQALFIALGSLAFVAVLEEVVFRGYILSNLLQAMNPYVAVGLSSLLFLLFHLGSPGFDFVASLNVLVVGLLLGFHYAFTRNLWFCLWFHLGWNFLQGPLLGFPVSGITFDSLLLSERTGDANITGGIFGLEGSTLLLTVTLLATASYFLLLRKRITAGYPLVPGQI